MTQLSKIRPTLDPYRVLQGLNVAVVLVDDVGRVAFVNDEACELLHCKPDGTKPLDAFMAGCGADCTPALPESPGAGARVTRLVMSDGRMLDARAKRLPGGSGVVTFVDLSALAQAAELNRRDPLTGLCSRTALRGALDEQAGAGRPFCLFHIGINGFGTINECCGRASGDALLRKMALRLRTLTGDQDVAARIAGVQFAVLKSGMVAGAEAEAYAARITGLLGRTYALEGHIMSVSVSVGAVVAPAGGREAEKLLRNAQLAMYNARAAGRDEFRFFAAAMDVSVQERQALVFDLRLALVLKELTLALQPLIELERNTIVGFETLLRWNHPQRGMVPPSLFIPIAEETGIIGAIGEWVLRAACQEAAKWARPVGVAVNLSPLQLKSANLIDTVESALAQSGIEPGRLELEITESALIENVEQAVQVLSGLRALGVKISLDDFGTGYSSLSYLQKFTFDKIKIDQSFVRDMIGNAQSGAIVRAVTAIGASFGIRTTAEGVETQEQLEAIRLIGCSEVQGYYTGRPMSAPEAAALLRRPETIRREDVA